MINPNEMNLGEMHKEGECSIKTGGLSNRDQIAKEIFVGAAIKAIVSKLTPQKFEEVKIHLARNCFEFTDSLIKESNRDMSQGGNDDK